MKHSDCNGRIKEILLTLSKEQNSPTIEILKRSNVKKRKIFIFKHVLSECYLTQF